MKDIPFTDILFKDLRERRPLIHCVTNYVTMNDCANLAYAIGASPMMAMAMEEAEEITARSSATLLNTGTPSTERFAFCRRCGCEANRLGHSVVVDPVGIGASAWRLRETELLFTEVRPTIIRANASECRALLRIGGDEKGVDSLSGTDLTILKELAAQAAKSHQCTVLLSDAVDIVSDGVRTEVVSGGSASMRAITGAGCMLSLLCTAFCAVTSDAFGAACSASRFWKACAERAESLSGGIGGFHMALFDAAEHLSLLRAID